MRVLAFLSVDQYSVDEKRLLPRVERADMIRVAVYRLPIGSRRRATRFVAEIVRRIDDDRAGGGRGGLEAIGHRFGELRKLAFADVRNALSLPARIEPGGKHGPGAEGARRRIGQQQDHSLPSAVQILELALEHGEYPTRLRRVPNQGSPRRIPRAEDRVARVSLAVPHHEISLPRRTEHHRVDVGASSRVDCELEELLAEIARIDAVHVR